MSESVAKVGELYGSTVPRSLYDREKELRETYERVIESSVVERVESLTEQNKVLSEQNIELRAKFETLNKSYSDLKSESDKRVEQAVKSIKRELQVEKEQSLKYQRQNIESKKVVPIKKEKEQVESERDRLQEMYNDLRADHSEMLTLLRDVFDVVTNIKTLIENNGTMEQVKEQVERVESVESLTVERDTKRECELIHQLLQEGKTQREIAGIVFPGDKRGERRVSDRKHSKLYERLFGEQ